MSPAWPVSSRHCSALHDPPTYVLYAMSHVPLADNTAYTRRASPLSCSNATSTRSCDCEGAEDHTCPMLFVTVHEGVHVYTSRNPSSLNVTTILVVGVVGDHAIRVRRIGLPAVDCSASLPHVDAAHALVFRLLTPLVPVLERYPISASSIMEWSRTRLT